MIRSSAVLRGFREPDMAPLRALIHETIHAAYRGIYPPPAIAYFIGYQTEEKILDRHQNGTVLVMEEDGEIIATGSVVGSYISSVFVRPAAQKHGHGGRIMEALEKIAVEKGIASADLNVSFPSRGFYEAIGYTILEEAVIDLGAGKRLDYWKASKDLSLTCNRKAAP